MAPGIQTRPNFEIVADTLAYSRQHKGLRLYANVIFDNHIHRIGGTEDLSIIIQAFNPTASQIIEPETLRRHLTGLASRSV